MHYMQRDDNRWESMQFFVRYALSLGLTHYLFFFFFNDTATTEIYTLSLHDALPIYRAQRRAVLRARRSQPLQSAAHPRGFSSEASACVLSHAPARGDRKSTRLNSSHT